MLGQFFFDLDSGVCFSEKPLSVFFCQVEPPVGDHPRDGDGLDDRPGNVAFDQKSVFFVDVGVALVLELAHEGDDGEEHAFDHVHVSIPERHDFVESELIAEHPAGFQKGLRVIDFFLEGVETALYEGDSLFVLQKEVLEGQVVDLPVGLEATLVLEQSVEELDEEDVIEADAILVDSDEVVAELFAHFDLFCGGVEESLLVEVADGAVKLSFEVDDVGEVFGELLDGDSEFFGIELHKFVVEAVTELGLGLVDYHVLLQKLGFAVQAVYLGFLDAGQGEAGDAGDASELAEVGLLEGGGVEGVFVGVVLPVVHGEFFWEFEAPMSLAVFVGVVFYLELFDFASFGQKLVIILESGFLDFVVHGVEASLAFSCGVLLEAVAGFKF